MSIISLCRLGEWVEVFNDTFCIVHPALTYNFWWPHWYLQPFISIVFLLCPVGQFYCLEKPSTRRRPSSCRNSLKKMYHGKLYQVHLAMSGIQADRVSGDRHLLHTYCTCSRKSNYQSITTTMANWSLLTDIWHEMLTKQGGMARVKEYMS